MKKDKIKNNHSFGYQLVRPLLKIFLTIFINPKTINKEFIPKDSGYILAGTHVSVYDPLIVGNVTYRSVHFLAKKELFDKKILGFILKKIGMISVNRKAKDNPDAKNYALKYLSNNKVLCLFPEGTINRKKENPILPFKYGAVSFAYKSGKPIVPFAIVGNPKLFNYHVKIIFGEPIYVMSDNLEQENKKLEETVIKLIEEGKKYEKRKA